MSTNSTEGGKELFAGGEKPWRRGGEDYPTANQIRVLKGELTRRMGGGPHNGLRRAFFLNRQVTASFEDKKIARPKKGVEYGEQGKKKPRTSDGGVNASTDRPQW